MNILKKMYWQKKKEKRRKSFNIFGKKSKIKKIFPDKRSNEHKNTKLGLIFRSKILLVD